MRIVGWSLYDQICTSLLDHHMVSLLKLPFFSIIQFSKSYPSLFFSTFRAFCPTFKWRARKSTPYEIGDEFFAQLDFLRNEYDHALETIDQQNADIRQLLALLIKDDIPIPKIIIDWYIRKTSDIERVNEELPFDWTL